MWLSVRGKSTCAPEKRGVRGLRHHAECPQVANTVIEAHCGSARVPLMCWRCSRRACHASWPSSACRAGAGTGCVRSMRWSSPSTRTPPDSRSGGSSPATAALGGHHVALLPPEASGGLKDASEAWGAGLLTVGRRLAAATAGGGALAVPVHLREAWEERAAIMMEEGGLPPTAAERLAWEGLPYPAETRGDRCHQANCAGTHRQPRAGGCGMMVSETQLPPASPPGGGTRRRKPETGGTDGCQKCIP